jgi:hypothetical protein
MFGLWHCIAWYDFTNLSKKCACCIGEGPKRPRRAEVLTGCKRADSSTTIKLILGRIQRSACGQVGNAWNRTSTALYVFIEWCTYHTTYCHSSEDRKLALKADASPGLTLRNLHAAHTVYFCVLMGLRSNRLLPVTALIGSEPRSVVTAWYQRNIKYNVGSFSSLNPQRLGFDPC